MLSWSYSAASRSLRVMTAFTAPPDMTSIQFLLSRIEMLTMQSCRGKVLAFLLAEKREDGVILLRGTRDELASRLSVSRAALYRELSALQSGGYLEVGESRLRVLNTSALEKLLYGV